MQLHLGDGLLYSPETDTAVFHKITILFPVQRDFLRFFFVTLLFNGQPSA
jgi:hypothetical protein